MTQWHLRSRRKLTGGLLKPNRKKKRRDRGRDFIPAKIGERKIKKKRARGGNEKLILLSDMYANVSIGNETKKAKILSVVSNPANPYLARQNIITKGCIIETELGKARVTSRPGQNGIVNAVLIEEKK
ncbi:MAG: 30S ribosomal protein S8e [Candidatus Aenigmarchaeota archaeon]|nr:30S ribosomal protein S8e [Candidatus Aenigmarchaeota archaeon]